MRKISCYPPFLFVHAVQNHIHLHAGRVLIMSRMNEDDVVLLQKGSSVNLPATVQMQEHMKHLEHAYVEATVPLM